MAHRDAASSGGLTLAELSERYRVNTDISDGAALNRQTFNRWRDGIFDVFGLLIECTQGAGYKYRIENPEALSEDVSGWLVDTYGTQNGLSAGLSLRDRILVDTVPSGRCFLAGIIGSMREGRVVSLTYRGFGKEAGHTFLVEPYCLRLFSRRWYVLGRSVAEDRLRLYALDRVESLEQGEETFSLPGDFDAYTYFASYFGVILDDSVPEERVLLRADGTHKHYLRTLPLHPSQRELRDDGESAYFELRLRPGYEFCMELLRAGVMVEVMEPQWLRHTMRGWVGDMWEMYKDD